MFSFNDFCMYSISGVDPSVKVVYKPVKRFREENGLLSKNVTYTYKQVTEISNTRSEPAVVTFQDQIPKSEDAKLKVRKFQHGTSCFPSHVSCRSRWQILSLASRSKGPPLLTQSWTQGTTWSGDWNWRQRKLVLLSSSTRWSSQPTNKWKDCR